MKCPFCETVMLSGKVSVGPSTLGALAEVLDLVTGGGSSAPHYLYFRQAGDGPATRVEHSGEAFRCGRCQALVIAGTAAGPHGRPG
jgi:hypothetical protein